MMLFSDFVLLSGRRAQNEKGCIKHFEGCEEVLDENRKTGKFNQYVSSDCFLFFEDLELCF